MTESQQSCTMLLNKLLSLEDEVLKTKLSYYFKTGKGQYGEGDVFLGIKMPVIRELIKPFVKSIDFRDIPPLLTSKYHEVRMAALIIWTKQLPKLKSSEDQKELVELYLSHTKHINNWDLVDLSAPIIMGTYLANRSRDILYQLAESTLLWDQRIAIVTTLSFIRKRDFEDALNLSVLFLDHKHDLIHKATGWCLREIGKKDMPTLYQFLECYGERLPRTALRYSIERMDIMQKERFMSIKKSALKK